MKKQTGNNGEEMLGKLCTIDRNVKCENDGSSRSLNRISV